MSKSITFIAVERIPQPNGALLIRPLPSVSIGEEITPRQFAEKVGLSPHRVRALCDEGKLKFRRTTPFPGSRIFIPISELERFLNFRE